MSSKVDDTPPSRPMPVQQQNEQPQKENLTSSNANRQRQQQQQENAGPKATTPVPRQQPNSNPKQHAAAGPPSSAPTTTTPGAGTGTTGGAQQITLAISQRDAVRMLDASRAFNESVRLLQDEDIARRKANRGHGRAAAGGEVDGRVGGAAAAASGSAAVKDEVMTDGDGGHRGTVMPKEEPDDDAPPVRIGRVTRSSSGDQGDGAKMMTHQDDPEVETDAKKKKMKISEEMKMEGKVKSTGTTKKAKTEAPPSPNPADTETKTAEEKRSPSPTSQEEEEGASESAERTKPSPPRNRRQKGTDDDETTTTSSKTTKTHNRQQRRRTPLHKLLIPAARSCPDPFIASYLRRMQSDDQRMSDREIEACLLLFLDMDKSTKLLTAFEVLGQQEEEEEDKSSSDGMDCDDGKKKQQQGDGEGATTLSSSTVPNNGQGQQDIDDDEDDDDDDEIVVPGPLSYDSTVLLFRSFLTSISTCIHRTADGQQQSSASTPTASSAGAAPTSMADASSASAEDRRDGPPSGSSGSNKVARDGAHTSPRSAARARDEAAAAAAGGDGSNGDDVEMQLCCDWPWTMSPETKAEIDEIANFAAEQLSDFAREAIGKAKGRVGSEGMEKEVEKINGDDGSEEAKKPAADATATAVAVEISFEAFGNWYNSGGFKHVPWLELLDLAKWDFAGRAAAAAAAAAARSDRHVHKRAAAAASLSAAASIDPLMGPIAEEAFPISPGMFMDGAEDGLELQQQRSSGPAAAPPKPSSRTVVSFDFTGAMPSSQPFQIRITEENLRMLKNLVTRTGLSDLSPNQVCDILLRHAARKVMPCAANSGGGGDEESVMVLTRDAFGRCIQDIIPSDAKIDIGPEDMESYTAYFANFYTCFDNSCSIMGSDCVNAKELAVGFSFLCAGNKSSKLATAYELLDDKNSGYLTQTGLTHYLRSYLTMLVGISLLTECAESTADTGKMLTERRRTDMFTAVENGARWTREQFISAFDKKLQGKEKESSSSSRNNAITFEDFAEWYTEGGYTVAPWLELLDLTKFLSLINDGGAGADQHYRRGGAPPPTTPAVEVMFTFPLANHQSLVVLREDATYVKSVVTQLCLSSMTPEGLWSAMYGHVKSKPLPPLPHKTSRQHKSGSGKSMDVDQTTFVSAMETIMRPSRKRPPPTDAGSPSPTDTLKNFFQSFDLHQVDRVAANELMGGLTLLCGGKKSMKLAFAFSLFDGRPDQKKRKKGKGKGKAASSASSPHSLDGKELFLFLRSFLIVMFSCCKQSLDLSAEEVSRYIYDTAHVIAEDVMKFQWHRRKSDRVDFDQFGEWYNEGGFETAPWLELLDLNKWVLSDEEETIPYRPSPRRRAQHDKGRDAAAGTDLKDTAADDDLLCPPAPPDDAIDPHNDPFFGDDIPMDGMDGMDGIDDMDFQMIAEEMDEKENVGNPATVNAPSPPQSGGRTPGSPAKNSSTGRNPPPAPSEQRPRPPPSAPATQPLKFHLLTAEKHGGYMVSISQRRVRHLRQLVVDSGLCKIDAAAACSRILEHGVPQKKGGPPMLTKERFDSAMRGVVALAKSRMTGDTQRHLSELLTGIFSSFDPKKKGEISAPAVAAGFTVLCGGRKSDKLEFAFDLLDMDKDGNLSRRDIIAYLQTFLTVLLDVSTSSALDADEAEDILVTMKGGKCGVNEAAVQRVIAAGSEWATQQVYTAMESKGVKAEQSLSFDDFADWYTRGGYTSIPWLELLDLRKWVLAAVAP